MARSVLEIVFRTLREGTGDRETKAALKDLESGFKSFMSVAGSVAAVGATLNAVYKNTVNVFVDYAAQVRDMSRVTGLNATETSKLIQAADDLTISYESLNKALWAASKQGIDVSIESLSAMADEYVALGSASEQAEFLAKRFGKSGAEMGKLLEQGGAGVRQMTDAISGGLVLTDQAVQNAREYEIALDNWNDSIEGLKVSIGSALLPVITDSIDGMNQYETALQQVANAHGITTYQAKRMEGSTRDLNQEIEMEATNLARAEMMGAAWAKQLNSVTSATEQATEAQEDMSRSNQDMLGLIGQLQGAQDDYDDKLAEINEKYSSSGVALDLYKEKQKELREQLYANTLTQAEYNLAASDLRNSYNDGTLAANEQQKEIQALAEAHEDASRRIAFSLLQQKLAMGGFSDTEFENLLSLGVSWGIFDEKVAQSAILMGHNMDMMAAAAENPTNVIMTLNEKVRRLLQLTGQSFDFYVNIHTMGSFPDIKPTMGGGGAQTGATYEMRAGGGPLGNGLTLVGEEGAEFVTSSGYVIPNEITRALLASGIVPGRKLWTGGNIPSLDGEIIGVPYSTQLGGTTVNQSHVSSPGVPSSVLNTEITQASQVASAMVPMAEATVAAVQTSAYAQQQASAEAVQTREVISAGNSEMAGLMRDTNQLLRAQQSNLTRAMIAAFQQANP